MAGTLSGAAKQVRSESWVAWLHQTSTIRKSPFRMGAELLLTLLILLILLSASSCESRNDRDRRPYLLLQPGHLRDAVGLAGGDDRAAARGTASRLVRHASDRPLPAYW